MGAQYRRRSSFRVGARDIVNSQKIVDRLARKEGKLGILSSRSKRHCQLPEDCGSSCEERRKAWYRA